MRLVSKEEAPATPEAAKPADAKEAEKKNAKENPIHASIGKTLTLGIGAAGSYLVQDWAVSSMVADKKAAAEKDPSKPMAEVYKDISGTLAAVAVGELLGGLALGYATYRYVQGDLPKGLLSSKPCECVMTARQSEGESRTRSVTQTTS